MPRRAGRLEPPAADAPTPVRRAPSRTTGHGRALDRRPGGVASLAHGTAVARRAQRLRRSATGVPPAMTGSARPRRRRRCRPPRPRSPSRPSCGRRAFAPRPVPKRPAWLALPISGSIGPANTGPCVPRRARRRAAAATHTDGDRGHPGGRATHRGHRPVARPARPGGSLSRRPVSRCRRSRRCDRARSPDPVPHRHGRDPPVTTRRQHRHATRPEPSALPVQPIEGHALRESRPRHRHNAMTADAVAAAAAAGPRGSPTRPRPRQRRGARPVACRLWPWPAAGD